ncbi:MAG: tetratricopeptide repeat protein [Treponema sp.]|nr:tetratricopeptide repeat protein [Treponema sp.]
MKGPPLPSQNELRRIYEKDAGIRESYIREFRHQMDRILSVLPSRPTVKTRVKDFPGFFKKYVKILKANPHSSATPVITDLVGIRIICPFIEDLEAVEGIIREHFKVVETERKGSNYSFKEFGYESTHLLIEIPPFIVEKCGKSDCTLAEVQIRTILQDAWAEVEHELVYKAEFTPFDDPMKRKLAAVNASLSLADTIFQEIRSYQRQLNGELGKRRNSFFQKIEEAADSFLFDETGTEKKILPPISSFSSSESIDDLLLNALYAHNRNRFDEAIDFYSRILEMKPDDTIRSLIYKHRGMANFAQSKYQEAIDDFSRSLELDGTAYKACYYRGVARSVLQDYSGAVEDFTKSLEINPYQSFCLFRRGQAWYHMDDYPKALSDCEASLSLDPESASVKKFRELLLNKLRM